MEIQEMLMKALVGLDNKRERSQQTEIGVSSVGGCRRQVYFQLNDEPKVNQTLRLPSIMGTALHGHIEKALTHYDFGSFDLEIEVEYEGLKGHIDCYIPESGAVIDWKTTKKSSMTKFPDNQQRWQVQLYGYLLSKTDRKIETVSLVAIARDGDERHIVVHTEKFDEAIALEALAWLQDVKTMTSPPPPERSAFQFCKHYCVYYGDNCQGKGRQ